MEDQVCKVWFIKLDQIGITSILSNHLVIFRVLSNHMIDGFWYLSDHWCWDNWWVVLRSFISNGVAPAAFQSADTVPTKKLLLEDYPACSVTLHLELFTGWNRRNSPILIYNSFSPAQSAAETLPVFVVISAVQHRNKAFNPTDVPHEPPPIITQFHSLPEVLSGFLLKPSTLLSAIVRCNTEAPALTAVYTWNILISLDLFTTLLYLWPIVLNFPLNGDISISNFINPIHNHEDLQQVIWLSLFSYINVTSSI